MTPHMKYFSQTNEPVMESKQIKVNKFYMVKLIYICMEPETMK